MKSQTARWDTRPMNKWFWRGGLVIAVSLAVFLVIPFVLVEFIANGLNVVKTWNWIKPQLQYVFNDLKRNWNNAR